MIERVLTWIVKRALRRPGAVLATLVVPAALSVFAFRVPLDLSFGGLMNRDDPEVARYFRASDRYGLGGWLPLLLEGPDARLDEGERAVRRALEGLGVVRSVVSESPREWLRERAPWLVPEATFDAWIAFARDPRDRVAGEALEIGRERLESRLDALRPPGARLLLVILADDPFDLALDDDAFPQVRRRVRDAVEPLGLRARFAGMAAIVTQEQEATLARLRILGPVSLVLVLLLLGSVDRRPLVLAGVAVPMVLAVGATLGVVGWWAGRLTLMESVFGVMVFGLGVDFAVHLMTRLREERAGGASFERGVELAVVGTGRGIIAGAVTSAGAFLILTLAPDPVFYHLGLSGGIGLLLCLVLLLAMLPAEWALLEGRARRRTEPPRALSVPLLGRLARAAVRWPAAFAGASVLLVAWGGYAVTHLRYETNLERVFSRDIRAVDTARRIHELFGLDPAPWVVPARNADEARRVERAFEKEPLFGRTESAAFLFPADADRRAEALAAAGPRIKRNLRLLRRAGIDGEAREALLALQIAAEQGPPAFEGLPREFRERWTGGDGVLLVYAFAREPHLDAASAALERRAAQAIHPDATSMSALFEALIGTDRPWMSRIGAGVLAFIILVLWADLRSPRLVLLALAPVAVGWAAALAVLQLLGFSFNTVTLVGVPLLLGLGVDDGIHVVHRLREEPHRGVDAVVDSVGSGIAMTTLTTCASVCTLLFSRHPGIESVAILLLVGLPLCLLASVTVLPALAVLLGAPGGPPGITARRSSP